MWFMIALVIFVAMWLFLALRGMAGDVKLASQFKWTTASMYLLVLIGAGGFFASALSATGVISLPPTREWPAGNVSGVIKTPSGKYVVPLIPSGRVQLYDSRWHFIRGWQVNAEGGEFKVENGTGDAIEVFTARGNHHYSFTDEGLLIASTTIGEEVFSELPRGESVVVPTPLLLWVFSSPFLSWAAMAIGFGGVAILKKIQGIARQTPLEQKAELEINVSSGTLRVVIHPKRHWIQMLVSAAAIVIFAIIAIRDWATTSTLMRGLLLWVTVGGIVAWFYQLSGSETIEFDAQNLTIHKNVLGWDRTSEYPISSCSELEWRQQAERENYGLQCKVGWRNVKFGQYTSEEEAIDILTALQRELPDVAFKMLATSSSDKKHFTTLDLC